MSLHSPRPIVFFAGFLFSLIINSYQLVAQPRQSDQATVYTLTLVRTDSQPRVTVKDVNHLKGTFKIQDVAKVEGYDEGWLVVKVTDATGKVLYETSCANPLDQYIEHVNEKGELDRTHVQVNTDIVNIRVPFDTMGYTVSLYTVDSNSRLTLLTTL